MFCGILNIILFYFCVYVHDKLAQCAFHIVTIGDQLDELCSFSVSLPNNCVLKINKIIVVTLHVGK